MQIDEKHFHSILCDLIDESPLACRGVFGVCGVEFTAQVETLAVTLGKPSVLKVNLEFLREHCGSERHVKAVLVHEFLHVLLRHTERISRMTPLLNLALDAIINAIIHRKIRSDYSRFMSHYYKDAQGAARLLRPIAYKDEQRYQGLCGGQNRSAREREEAQFFSVWQAVYRGELVADDVYELVRKLKNTELRKLLPQGRFLLGDHSSGAGGFELGELDSDVARQFREMLRSIDGKGVWKNPEARAGTFARSPADVFPELDLWRRKAWQALKECIVPDQRAGVREVQPRDFSLPVLNSHDRRGFLRSLWSPLLPDIGWQGYAQKPTGTVQIYLDVSGSMDGEVNELIRLLISFGACIRQPFWAFSDQVEPARIRNNRLETKSTGGTSINAVLEHIARSSPERAVIITDGYVEQCRPELLRRIGGQTIRVIMSARGCCTEFERAGIACVKLDKLPA